ncbi:replication initiation factor domain-containing protein [Planctobacterium marinum]|uniref:replication initiation factor domain-containing protein n=1 Tax=Planctobacterium marinum TaxID=1631968 RepID=UPI001E3A2D13|nr:replication initiation factor domain-containing protein [Planctobacterium marinum]MCC2604101.1 replication initiation factor domain-containing protein [Planctobacterium marinum]
MNKEWKLHDTLFVDHLAFTVPVADFRHLNRAGKESTKRNQWVRLPQPLFRKAKTQEAKEALIRDYQAKFREVCYQRCHQFIEKILNLKVGHPRNKGLHGYNESRRLYDPTGKIEVGFLAYGGNNDTVYIQISGTGCQHTFAKIRPFVLHFWLSKVLSIIRLSRIDIAYDDFTGNFGTKYAESAYADNGFNNPKGGRTPQLDIRRPRTSKELFGDTVYVGSRKSPVYWRIYDKSLEQGVPGKTWYRTEVELKKVSVAVLEDLPAAFAALCAFSASYKEQISADRLQRVRLAQVKTRLEFAGKIRWARRQVGKLLTDVAEHFNGDIERAYTIIARETGGKFSLPDTYKHLLNFDLRPLEEVKPCNYS